MSVSFNLSQDHTYIDRSSSCLFRFESGPHLNRSAIFLLFPCQFEFLRPHLYQTVIILSVWVCVLRSHPYRSTIFLSFCVQFESGPHLYRSIIILSNWVESCSPPSHTYIVESCSISSHHFCLVLEFRVIVHIHSGTFSHHLSMFFMFKVISPQLYHSESVLSIHIHWHCTFDLRGFALVLIFLTSLPYAYCLFIIVLPNFLFQCTWHGPWVHDAYFSHVVRHPTPSILT